MTSINNTTQDIFPESAKYFNELRKAVKNKQIRHQTIAKHFGISSSAAKLLLKYSPEDFPISDAEERIPKLLEQIRGTMRKKKKEDRDFEAVVHSTNFPGYPTTDSRSREKAEGKNRRLEAICKGDSRIQKTFRKMTNEQLRSTLAANIENNKAELKAILGCYDIASEMEKYEDKLFADIAKKILAENDFRFPEDNDRMDVKKGERILNDDDTFLMGESDRLLYRQMVSEANLAAGLTDEKGYYTSNIRDIRHQAYKATVEFVINRILPDDMRKPFQENKLNITQTDRLIEIIRPALK